MYIVLDLEFYHNSKREELGPIKQLGAFKFNDKYQIVDMFEMTVTKYTPKALLQRLFNQFTSDVETIYVWAKNNDIRALNEVLSTSIANFEVIDVQEYFKDVNLASLSTISEALHFEPEGRHNALIDAEYTFEIIKHFNLNDITSRNAIETYVQLIRSNETNRLQKKSPSQDKYAAKGRKDYKLVHPGAMEKLDDYYYQITSDSVIKSVIESLVNEQISVSKDGDFEIDSRLEAQVITHADIIFSNTSKFSKIARKFNNKMIIIVDGETVDGYLGIFISKKAYKRFIK